MEGYSLTFVTLAYYPDYLNLFDFSHQAKKKSRFGKRAPDVSRHTRGEFKKLQWGAKL